LLRTEESAWHRTPASLCRCRYKISHLSHLPALFVENEQLKLKRAEVFTKMCRSVAGPRPTTASVQDWTSGQCGDWLEHDVSLPEHVPLFEGAGIDGAKLLCLDEPKLTSLGIDDVDCEIILARLQLLERIDRRSKSSSHRPVTTMLSAAVLYETPVEPNQ
jgi:hypothetical protein